MRILMIADFLEPIAGLSFVRSQMCIGKKRINNTKIPIDELFTVIWKNIPKPKISSMKPIT